MGGFFVFVEEVVKNEVVVFLIIMVVFVLFLYKICLLICEVYNSN